MGDGSDHFLFVYVVVCDDAARMTFKSVTAAFQLRPLSKVDIMVEQVTTSGDIPSLYLIAEENE